MNIDERLKQNQTNIDVLKKQREELLAKQKKQEVPESVSIYLKEVMVGVSGPFIIVRGSPVNRSTDDKVNGYPITVSEAKKMIKALQTMIDYQESK